MCGCGKREKAGRRWVDGKREGGAGRKRKGAKRKASTNRKVNFFITRLGEGFRRAALLAEASGKSLQDVMALKKPENTWKDVAESLGVTKDRIKAVHQNIAAIKLETGRKASANRKVNFFITRLGEGFSRAVLLAEASGKSLQDVMALKKSDNAWKDVAESLGVTKEQIKAVHQNIATIKLEKKLSIPKQTSLDLLQQGYRSRDIAVANKLSKNTGKSINDILGMKKINNSWHDVANALGVDSNTFKQNLKNLKAAFPHKVIHGFHGE